jgi:hypothetical protein
MGEEGDWYRAWEAHVQAGGSYGARHARSRRARIARQWQAYSYRSVRLVYIPGLTYWTDGFKNRDADIADSIACMRYYAGWADKIQGKVRYISFYHCSYLTPGVDDRSQRSRQVCLYSARTRGRLRSDVRLTSYPIFQLHMGPLTEPNECRQYSLELSDYDVGMEGEPPSFCTRVRSMEHAEANTVHATCRRGPPLLRAARL